MSNPYFRTIHQACAPKKDTHIIWPSIDDFKKVPIKNAFKKRIS